MQLSERIAEFAPQLTLDFISEVSAAMNGMGKEALSQRLGCLHYISPWIKNLAHFSNPTSPLFERSAARLRDCIRVMADLSVTFPEVSLNYVYYEFALISCRSLPLFSDVSGVRSLKWNLAS